MKTKLIMLDTPIIVSDEEISKNSIPCYCYNSIKNTWDNDIILFQGTMPMYHYKGFKKIIAGIKGLPSIDWNGLEEEFGWIDVKYICESLVDSKTSAYIDSSYRKTLEKYTMLGFKKAQSLNEKKFNLEKFELADLIRKSYLIHGNDSWVSIAKDVIENLSKPKVFDIEVETEVFIETTGTSEFDFIEQDSIRPKITNNSIKILRKL